MLPHDQPVRATWSLKRLVSNRRHHQGTADCRIPSLSASYCAAESLFGPGHPIEASGRRRRHPNHVKIKPAIEVEIRQRVRHPERAAIVYEGSADIRELPLTVVEVEVNPGEVVHDCELP